MTNLGYPHIGRGMMHYCENYHAKIGNRHYFSLLIPYGESCEYCGKVALKKRYEVRDYYRKVRQERQQEIDKALTRPRDFGYHGDLPMFDTWSLGAVIEHRDSGLLDQSNAAAIKKAFEEYDPECESWEITSCSHWAVGWVEHLSFKVVERRVQVLHTEVIVKSAAFDLWNDLQRQQDNYAVLDEEDYSQRELDATYSNLEQAGKYCGIDAELPENYADQLYSWLADNDPNELENQDDRGAWPGDESLQRAIRALGWAIEE